VRYLTLSEALVVAETVTDMEIRTLLRVTHLGLLDSALHAPQAGFAGVELYPAFADKAAVLVVHLTRNHPLPDGNKRLAWQCLTIVCALNGCELQPADEAVDLMSAIAAGELGEAEVAEWLSARLTPGGPGSASR
jgi:death-on-curing protein